MELGSTFQKVRKQLRDLNQRLDRLKGELSTDTTQEDGISLLQLKAVTLLGYNGDLARYSMNRVQGKGPSSELRESLCRKWAVLDVSRPLERKLKPQIVELLDAARQRPASDGKSEAALEHRPNPAAMVNASDSDSDSDADSDAGAGDKGTYVPPRFAETDVGDADSGSKAKAEARRARMRRGQGARAMLAELRGLPDEEVVGGSLMHARASAEERARSAYEEDNFLRLARRKRERVRSSKHRDGEEQIDGLDGLSKFADGVLEKKKKREREAAAATATETAGGKRRRRRRCTKE